MSHGLCSAQFLNFMSVVVICKSVHTNFLTHFLSYLLTYLLTYFLCSLTYSRLPTNLLTYLSTHSCTYLLIDWLTHSLTHLLILLLVYLLRTFTPSLLHTLGGKSLVWVEDNLDLNILKAPGRSSIYFFMHQKKLFIILISCSLN